MEYISKKEYEGYLSKIDKYKKHCENLIMPCAICGKKSTTYVSSLIGSFKWYMCDEHENVDSYFGGGSMGVMVDGKETPMKYLDEQYKIHNQLKDIK